MATGAAAVALPHETGPWWLQDPSAGVPGQGWGQEMGQQLPQCDRASGAAGQGEVTEMGFEVGPRLGH